MEWFRQLTAMIDEGEINEAENELLEGINANSMKDYELVLWFYAYLNEKDNAFLEIHNFSRKESPGRNSPDGANFWVSEYRGSTA